MRTLALGIALLAAAVQARAEETTAQPGAASSSASETMDLTEEKDAFTPYANERHPLWALLPATAIALVLLHLRKSKPPKRVSGGNS